MSSHPAAALQDDRIPLHPFPEGWYCLGFRWEFARPQVGTWLGRQLEVAWPRGGDATVRALDGGPAPDLRVQQDAVFAWHSPMGEPPRFHLPQTTTDGWTGYAGHTWHNLATHPQETSENSVDLAHFRVVHNYSDVEVIQPAEVDGAHLRARYAFVRPMTFAGVRWFRAEVEFELTVAGLGYSLVDAHVITLGVRTRQMVYATPRAAGRCDLRIALACPHAAGPLAAAAARLARDVAMPTYIHDVSQDLTIWQTKRHLLKPRVVAGDGPIGRYRAWCQQFYPAAA